MNREDVDYGQRSRVDLPGVGDHGQVGTVTRVRGNLSPSIVIEMRIRTAWWSCTRGIGSKSAMNRWTPCRRRGIPPRAPVAPPRG